jgi:hypothetical protein
LANRRTDEKGETEMEDAISATIVIGTFVVMALLIDYLMFIIGDDTPRPRRGPK